MRRLLVASARTARRVVVAVVGTTVVLLGVVLLFKPGPAIVVIPIGLAILATEFVWAQRLLRRVKDGAVSVFSARRLNRDGLANDGERSR